MTPADVAELVDQARAGRARAVARLISLVEQQSPALAEVAAQLAPHTGNAHVIGLTGSPGVGKSTTTGALVSSWRRRGRRVGVLAIDPSSPFSGGALLGDRIRMQEHSTDASVFIRSMATRGYLGGLAAAAPQAIRVLDAAGCDIVVVETVGVGQSEIDIASLADTSIVVLAPGMGDGIQAAKAGILEIGDVFVINKADREGARATRRELRTMLSMTQRPDPAWTPPILMTVASRDEGMDAVVEAANSHFDAMSQSGRLEERRVSRARNEIEALALQKLRQNLGAGDTTRRLAMEVQAGRLDSYAAAEALIGATANTDDTPGAPTS